MQPDAVHARFWKWLETNGHRLQALLYGKDESDSLCPQVQRGKIKAQALPGGHHFDGAYDKLAQLILSFSAGLQ